jgi:phosphoserine phosphatase RsbU/P
VPQTEMMQCMEVWGGNQPTDSGVVMSGLDAWVYCKPFGASAGGGDVYYVSSCATGRITRLLVADVSGHGAAVSELAADLRAMMRRYVNYLDQSRFVGEMNRQFTSLAKLGTFATAVVTTFFAPTNHLSLCNAGHPPPLLYRAAARKWSFLQPGGPANDASGNVPFGIEDATSYDQFDVRLKVGDLVLCYTDCLPEARGRDGEFLGQEGLLEIAQSIDASDPAQVIASLLKVIGARGDGTIEGDDVTLLLFRPNGLAPRPPLHRRLMAPFKLGKAIVQSLRPNGQPVPWPDFSIANLGGAMFGPLNRFYRRRMTSEE